MKPTSSSQSRGKPPQYAPEPGRSKRKISLLIPISILVGLIYLWFVSIGTWTHLSQTSTYFYRRLADGFLAGQLGILEQPDPRLLQLSNPYTPEARGDIPYITDVVLYRGQYFVYWGPVPALLMAGFKLISGKGFSDGYVVFGAGLVTFFFSTLILAKIWHRHFRHLPVALLCAGILFTGLAYPIPWVLNQARIYEAAIFAGVAFLVAGLYFAFDFLEEQPAGRFSLLLTGICWGMAIGTRLILGGAVAFFLLAMLGRLLRRKTTTMSHRRFVLDLSFLLAPIGCALLALGLYNFLRFGDPLQTGVQYMLAGPNVSQLTNYFNPIFAIPNLINYLFNPYTIDKSFPFLIAMPANASIYHWLAGTEDKYYIRSVTGILLTTPFFLFAGSFGWRRLRTRVKGQAVGANLPESSTVPEQKNLLHLIAAISLAVLATSLTLILYCATNARYLLDFTPLLSIISVSGAWFMFAYYQDSLWKRRTVGWIILITVVYSLIVSILLGISGNLGRIREYNPALFNWLVHLFTF